MFAYDWRTRETKDISQYFNFTRSLCSSSGSILIEAEYRESIRNENVLTVRGVDG